MRDFTACMALCPPARTKISSSLEPRRLYSSSNVEGLEYFSIGAGYMALLYGLLLSSRNASVLVIGVRICVSTPHVI